MKNVYKFFYFFLVLAGIFILLNCVPSEKPYDLVLKNGFIIDGSGNPWFKGDIAIRDKKIVKVGSVDESQADVAPYGGIYASHIRDQGRHITEAIGEVVAENGKHTGKLPGMMLYGQGKK